MVNELKFATTCASTIGATRRRLRELPTSNLSGSVANRIAGQGASPGRHDPGGWFRGHNERRNRPRQLPTILTRCRSADSMSRLYRAISRPEVGGDVRAA